MDDKQISVFIIAALTADGFIGKNTAHFADWTSKEDKQFFVQMTKKAGVVVMGSNTYQTIGKPLPGRLNIVYSRDKQFEGAETTQKTPAELVENLKARGYREVAICGGSTIYSMFLEAGVVNKLYLTVEPIVFGSGIHLFNKEIEKKLQLVLCKNLNEQVVLLEYNVIN